MASVRIILQERNKGGGQWQAKDGEEPRHVKYIR